MVDKTEQNTACPSTTILARQYCQEDKCVSVTKLDMIFRRHIRNRLLQNTNTSMYVYKVVHFPDCTHRKDFLLRAIISR